MNYKSEFLKIMHERGFVYQISNLDKLDELASKESITAYIGFDCTAKSLHVGSLVQIMMLRWLQKTGHRPIVVMGGGTTKVGDPSGKDKSRQMLTVADIQDNKDSIFKVFEKYLHANSGQENDMIMVDNDEWLSDLKYLDFLRDYGPHFTINRMMTFESVKLRLDRQQPLTFLEFNYMLLQAFDFYQLNKEYGCVLQMGGSDQWGNLINGIELIRRINAANSNTELSDEEAGDSSYDKAFALTTALLTTADGKKMGKSESGAVWLNEDMLSSYEFWQFWRNVQDADVGKFLRLFTELPLDEISKLENLEGADINQAKIVLANEVTTMCHGADKAAQAQQAAQAVFSEGASSQSLPTFEISQAEFDQGLNVANALQLTQLAKSNSEARRIIKGNGCRINNELQSNHDTVLDSSMIEDGSIKVSHGKKKHALLKIV